MSWWTYINGFIEVEPAGWTQPEKRYILETVLAHLPKVTGSEKDMFVHIVQKEGYSGSSNFNEFYEPVRRDDFETQDCYYLVLEGTLRDRMFNETLHELNKFLNRLAKRLYVDDILIRLSGHERCNNIVRRKEIIISNVNAYEGMYECNTSSCDCEHPWWEYLLWDRDKSGGFYPEKLTYKYPKLKLSYERDTKCND